MFYSKSSSFFKCITIFTLAIIITTVTSCSNKQNSAASSIKNTNQNNELINNTQKDSDTTNNNSKNDNALTECEKNSINITIRNKGFIFPNSDKKLISNEELNYCDKFTLLLAKNELFARKGYKFKNKQLLNYYNNMSWYTPNDDIKNSVDELNEIEKKNLKLINEKYNDFHYFFTEKGMQYEINTEKDLNNDGFKENINISFKKDSESYSWEEYTFTINSNGKKYTLSGTEEHLYLNLFFADFDTKDNNIEFYITSDGPSGDPTTIMYQLSENGIKEILKLDGHITNYDGKGNIYTFYNFTNDKNQVLLSYYNLKKDIQYPNGDEIIGKYLQYDYHLILYKSRNVRFSLNYYNEDDKQSITKKLQNGDIIKITDINEPLKIVYMDNLDYDQVINIPIKVETKDGLTGWLLYPNGGA
jgi:YARHG domain-containing protein